MFHFHRLWVWVPLAWCATCAAATGTPRQLCEVGLTPQHTIASIYRYARDPAQRTLEGAEHWSCDPSRATAFFRGIPMCDDGMEARGCGVDDHVETEECLDLRNWWTDYAFSRLSHLTEAEDAPPLSRTPWPDNVAVEVLGGFPYRARYDVYRVWTYAAQPAPQFRGTVEELVYGHGRRHRCYTMAYLVGFFNGVWNTRREAWASLEVIQQPEFLGPTWRGAPVRYELFYNQSCKRSADDVCLQDVAEVFRQRSTEINGLLSRRWEYFWEQVTGQHEQPGSFTQRLRGRVAGSGDAMGQWFDALANATLAKITAMTTALAENPPTVQDTTAHTAQLVRAGERAERAVLVAHSQGNLFVNAAYDAYLAHARRAGAADGEDTGYVAAEVVHIAPASPTLRGPYLLADSDLVINGLRRVDGTYLPTSNITLDIDRRDSSGHKLLDTYLDASRPVREQVRQLITQALDAL